MKLAQFILPDATVPALAATDRNGAIAELVGALASAGAIAETDAPELVAALVRREASGTTGFGKGVAIPHIKHARVPKMAAAVGVSPKGVDFAALDKQPVHTVVVLLSPEWAKDDHVRAMNVIFQTLHDDKFRRFLRTSTDRAQVLEVLAEADGQYGH